MPPTDFSTPDPNDAQTRLARNNRLAQFVSGNSDDITDAYLETLPSGRTRWVVVYRDGTKDQVPN